MPAKLITSTYTIETKCSNCKKTVNAIKIEQNIRSYLSEDARFKSTLILLGCPKCKSVFYHE